MHLLLSLSPSRNDYKPDMITPETEYCYSGAFANSPAMAQAPTDSVQDTVSMLAHDKSALEITVQNGSNAPSRAPCVMEKKPRKKTCARQRDRVQAVRDLVVSLQHQLRALHEDYELRESIDMLLDRASSDNSQRWKFRAMRERSLKQHAEQQNARMRQRVATNSKFLRQVTFLANKQMTKTWGGNHRFVAFADDNTRIFSALRARLDARSSQLDTSIPQRRHESTIVSAAHVAPSSWVISAVDRGVNIDFDGSFAAPFDPAVVFRVMSRFTLPAGVEVVTEKVRIESRSRC